MADGSFPLPRYSLWQAIGVALGLATRAIEEARAGKAGPQGERGERGDDGRTPAIRGAWKAGNAYEALDVVVMGGSSFVALCDDPGACPGDGWQIMARGGKAGPPGPRGEIGERGYPAGPPGAQPVALSVDDEGMLTLRMSDGGKLECDLYPLLSRIVR